MPTPFQNHLFVSYARVDDQPVQGEEKWVTELVREVRTQIDRKLGRIGSCRIWMDHELRGNARLTDEIEQQVNNSAVMLVLLSPGYLESDWCLQELACFLEANSDNSRLFLVEIDKMELADRPPGTEDLLGYCFWAEDDFKKRVVTLGLPASRRDARYWDRVVDLSHDIANELKSATDSEPDDRPAILLAEVTEDLLETREGVARKLESEGFRIVPSKSLYPRESASAYRQAIDEDLKQCVVFVQLLSHILGRKLPGDEQLSYIEVQHQQALQAQKPVLQWRDRALDVDKASGAARKLLKGSTVHAGTLNEFHTTICNTVNAELDAPVGRAEGGFVYMSCHDDDEELAGKIADWLDTEKVGYDAPSSEELPPESTVAFYDGLLIVYGKGDVFEMRKRVRDSYGMRFRSPKPPPVTAVYLGPPEDKPSLRIKPPGILFIEGSEGINEVGLGDFVDALRSKTPQSGIDAIRPSA